MHESQNVYIIFDTVIFVSNLKNLIILLFIFEINKKHDMY